MTIEDLILQYARQQALFNNPDSINAAIDPSPRRMSDSDFGIFFRTLSSALTDAGINTELRLGELRDVKTWADLAALIAGRQA